MTDTDFVLMCIGLGFALSVIFIGKRGGGCMRNPPPPVNYVRQLKTKGQVSLCAAGRCVIL